MSLTSRSMCALVIALLATFGHAADQPDVGKKLTLGDIIDRSADSVVQVTALSADGNPVGMGSGFVIDAKGLVATNFHVVRRGKKIIVHFKDGTKCDAKQYRALERNHDLALLELDSPPAKLTPLTLAGKTPPRQGASVIAIGHPQGLSFTVTTGIVSAVRKTEELPRDFGQVTGAPKDLLWVQTTAPVSPGNSGGPLLDDEGRVVGVNTFISLEGQNLNFAVHVSHLTALTEKPKDASKAIGGETLAKEVDNPIEGLEPRVEEMLNEFTNAQREYERLSAFTRRKEQEPSAKYAQRLFEIADSQRKTLTAVQALVLACRLDADTRDKAQLVKILERLTEDHATDPGLHHALPMVFRAVSSEQLPVLLRKVIEHNPNAQSQGLAAFWLVQALNSKDPAANEAEILRVLDRCTTDFKDVPFGVQKLGTIAGPLAFKIKNLSVGKTPPDIVGKDIEGKEFKLSDFRGKVVLLDFFADWCPHCSRMYPEERKLVEQYADKPFVLIGVNTDSKDTLRQIIEQKKVTWRCFSDANKAISEAWQVDSYPHILLLDHDGVIREVFAGRPESKKLNKLN